MSGKANLEIESRFRVKFLPPEIITQLRESQRIKITQGYLPDDGLRIRRIKTSTGETTYFKAEKKKTETSETVDIKIENEERISREEFRILWRQTRWRRIKKTRYNIPFQDGLKLELDIFKKWGVRRRMLVEVEFTDQEQASNFVPREWFEKNVTNKVSNRKLARREKSAIRSLKKSAKFPVFFKHRS